MSALEERLKEARLAYEAGSPIMTDAEYDIEWENLRKESPESPEITAVGAASSSIWPKRKHEIPMGSLDKIQPVSDGINPVDITDELNTWWAQTQETARVG